MTNRAAIILAGGKGKRFQTTHEKWQDKALAELNGKPLIVHAIENIQDVVDEIVVITDENKSRIAIYDNVLTRYHVKNARIMTDVKMKNLSGPLIAILTGLKFATADYCITIPCDVPMLSKKVAKYMFKEINSFYVDVPMWPNGRLETLLMVLERKSTLEITNVLCQLERFHPDDIIRGSPKTVFISPLGEIKTLDPELRSFVNINCQEDLNQLLPRQGKGPFFEKVSLNLGFLPVEKIRSLEAASSKKDNSDFWEASKIFSSVAVIFERQNWFFWAALSREHEAKSLLGLLDQKGRHESIEDAKEAFWKAAQNYEWEAKIYEKNHCYSMSERARADKSWCILQIEKSNTK
jgi:molybdopterin-guanine dinucleotide biosynthesis protein A